MHVKMSVYLGVTGAVQHKLFLQYSGSFGNISYKLVFMSSSPILLEVKNQQFRA